MSVFSPVEYDEDDEDEDDTTPRWSPVLERFKEQVGVGKKIVSWFPTQLRGRNTSVLSGEDDNLDFIKNHVRTFETVNGSSVIVCISNTIRLHIYAVSSSYKCIYCVQVSKVNFKTSLMPTKKVVSAN